MKFNLIIFLSIFAFSCSGDVEKKHNPEQKSAPQKSKPVNSQKPIKKEAEEHISGVGEARVSGAPSSTHISGQ